MPESRVCRTVALMGADGAGKTSLTESFLRLADAANHPDVSPARLDSEPEEARRQISLNVHTTSFEESGRFFHALDCPGFPNFMAEVEWALQVSDGALLAISAAQGAHLRTEHFYDLLVASGRPAIGIISRLDHDKAEFESVISDVENSLKVRPVPLNLPLGIRGKLKGIVDLMSMKAHVYEGFGKFTEADIPADMQADAERWRTILVETAAESDDALLGHYLESGALSPEQVNEGLKLAMRRGKALPIACEAAVPGIGQREILNLVAVLLPGPEERIITGKDLHGSPVERKPARGAPFVGQVYRTSVDPFQGRMTHLRVFAGTLRTDDSVFDMRNRGEERVAHLYRTDGPRLIEIKEALPGDVAIITRLKSVQTGDTLCTANAPMDLPKLQIPERTIAFALPSTIDEKVTMTLHKLLEEDPLLKLERSETGETLLWGMGQGHIDVTLERARRKYNIEVELTAPEPAYHETITATANGHGRHKRQTGGHGQFGDCHVEFSPQPRGKGYEFEDAIVGGVIPRNFIPSVDKGIHAALGSGPLAGFPLVDLKAKLHFGSYHAVDSSDAAFQVAGSLALKEAMKEAKPILLEPYMKLEVGVPEEMVGTVMGDLSSRRARVLGMEPLPRAVLIRAACPHGELLSYDQDLRSMTQGVGYFRMEPSHYEAVPPPIAQKIIERRRAEGKVRGGES